jgi:hypothetical protein
MSDPTLVEWILAEANGEDIEAVVIGNDLRKQKWMKRDWDPALEDFNKVLPWKEARKYLDYQFDDSFGAAGCDPITAWTKSKVIFVSEYDGSTRIRSVPRHPTDHEPEYA